MKLVWADVALICCPSSLHPTALAKCHVAQGDKYEDLRACTCSFVQMDGSLDIARLTFMQTSFSGHLLFGLQMRALAEMENSGVVSLLEGDKYEDLQRMYLLFKRVDGGLDLARSMLSEHLKSSGKALIMDPERTKEPVEFVHRLLTEKDKYDR